MNDICNNDFTTEELKLISNTLTERSGSSVETQQKDTEHKKADISGC